MILTLRKKTLIWIAAAAAAVLAATVVLSLARAASAAPRSSGVTVVIDAGHGGVDGGVSGKNTGVKESDLNLAVAQKLRSNFENFGVKVVMTRENGNGLYGLSNTNRKRRDMEERRRIIEEAHPAAVISVHMNYFPQSGQRGAQIFYRKSSDGGRALAEAVYSVTSRSLPASDRAVLSGDYYILNCHEYPAVIVECGFLSNAEDERLLITAEYQEKLAHNIFAGAIVYLSDQT
jgi:N-acetylmuramoyl-L-alanine amidase